jgi:hypothetical protein
LRQRQGGPRPAFAGDGEAERPHSPRPPASLPPLLSSSPSSLALKREVQGDATHGGMEKKAAAPPRVLSPVSAFPTRESAPSSRGCTKVPLGPTRMAVEVRRAPARLCPRGAHPRRRRRRW